MIFPALLRLVLRVSMRRLNAEWAAGLDRPRDVQAERLQAILTPAATCEYGREHSFAQVTNVDEYRRATPIVSHEDIAPQLERVRRGEYQALLSEPPEMFTVTSGTTGEPKYIPVTRAMNLEQHRSHRLWMHRLVADHPGIAAGKLFSSVSPAVEGCTEAGIPWGSASGKNYLNQPIPVRRIHALPYEAICVKGYEARYYVHLAFALASELSCVTSVNPSTLHLLARKLDEWAEPLMEDLCGGNGRGCLDHCPNLLPEERSLLVKKLRPSKHRIAHLRTVFGRDGTLTPATAWTAVQALCTWHGGNAPFYLEKLRSSWGDVPTRCLGLRASEGMFSIPLADGTPEGALATWGHFLEFLPEEVAPTADAETLLAHELERGRRYRLIITTSGGLYRYDLADIVEVTGFLGATPMVAFLHKAGQVLSITGEKVTEDQAVAAVRKAGAALDLNGFTVTLRLGEPPHYLLAVEPGRSEPTPETGKMKSLADSFDVELRQLNIEYAAKRDSGRLGDPEVRLVPIGTYGSWRRAQVARGRPDGQIKPPHLVRSEVELEEILRTAASDSASVGEGE